MNLVFIEQNYLTTEVLLISIVKVINILMLITFVWPLFVGYSIIINTVSNLE
jgi:hypothetical protein